MKSLNQSAANHQSRPAPLPITFPCPQFSILQQATPKINHENKIFIGSRPPISGLVKHGQELCAVGNSVAVSVAAVLSRAACLQDVPLIAFVCQAQHWWRNRQIYSPPQPFRPRLQ